MSDMVKYKGSEFKKDQRAALYFTMSDIVHLLYNCSSVVQKYNFTSKKQKMGGRHKNRLHSTVYCRQHLLPNFSLTAAACQFCLENVVAKFGQDRQLNRVVSKGFFGKDIALKNSVKLQQSIQKSYCFLYFHEIPVLSETCYFVWFKVKKESHTRI